MLQYPMLHYQDPLSYHTAYRLGNLFHPIREWAPAVDQETLLIRLYGRREWEEYDSWNERWKVRRFLLFPCGRPRRQFTVSLWVGGGLETG